MIVPVDIIGVTSPVMVVLVGILMVVLRAGASRVYFDVIGTFQAARMLKDAQAMSTTMNSLMLDAFSGIEETAQILTEPIAAIVDELIPIAREVAEARIEFEKFVQEAENFDAIADNIVEIGHSFGFAADEALMAGARMAQLGGVLGPGMTPTGTEIGIKFGLISGMETEAAMQRMINLQQQTDFMTAGLEDNLNMEERAQKIRQNSMRVLDQLNTVENRSAATMEQVTFVMNQFASQAHLTGESIAFMAAMSATLIEAGEEQGKGGRALRMIYARLGANTSGAADELHRLGVATRTADGELRPLSDILRDLDGALEGMGAAQLQATTQIVAGNRHYVRMIKLLENFERVEQLALEATLLMSPAQDEVNRRLEKQVVQLQIAEARLHDYKAAIGDSLVPALTEATERQGDFAIAMGELATGGLKGAVGGMLFFMQTMRNVLGPMIQTTISLQQLNVASQTYAVLQRAIAGQELVRKDFLGRLNQEQDEANAMQQESISLSQGMAQAKKELLFMESQHLQIASKLSDEQAHLMSLTILDNSALNQISQEKINQKTFEIQKINEQRAAVESLSSAERESLIRNQLRLSLDKEYKTVGAEKAAVTRLYNQQITDEASAIAFLDTMYDRQLDNIDEEISKMLPLIQSREESNRLLRERLTLKFGEQVAADLMKKIAAERVDKAAMEANMKSMQARTAVMSRMSMATMMASMAVTMLGDSEKSARTAIVLSTMSMLPFIMSMMQSTAAVTGEAAAKGFSAMVGEKLGVAQFQAAFATQGLAAAARGAAASLTAMAIASGGALLIGMAISALAVKFGLFNTKFNETSELLAASPLMDAEKIVENFAMDITDLGEAYGETSEQIRKYTVAIEEAKNRGDNTSDLEAELQALQKTNAEQKNALDLKKAESIINDLSQEQIDGLLATSMKQLRAEKEFQNQQRNGMARAAQYNGAVTDHMLAQSIAISEASKKTNELLGLYNQLSDAGIESAEALELTMGKLTGIQAANAANSVGAITDELKDAEQALYDFDNAREELFFGFAASNVTGDLVKQVVNKGVETLITNTEVIMTNNFNGMTTDQVANEILAQIERKAGSVSGISFS